MNVTRKALPSRSEPILGTKAGLRVLRGGSDCAAPLRGHLIDNLISTAFQRPWVDQSPRAASHAWPSPAHSLYVTMYYNVAASRARQIILRNFFILYELQLSSSICERGESLAFAYCCNLRAQDKE